MILVMLCLQGPVLRTWFGVLDKRVVMKNPAYTGFAKMFVDQLLMAPVLLGSFIAVNSILQGNSWSKVKSDVTANYKDIILTNYQVMFPTVLSHLYNAV